MMTERRGVRRGMTVLGKIPVPRPVNLPSQRLENRGLDPNVEIVPRGTVTWGNAARSPPTSTNNWGGNGSQPSSPPVSGGAWGSKPASAWGPNSSRPSSAGSTRPTSAGGSHPSSAPRPASAGGRHSQELARPSSAGNQEAPSQNAWGPPHRPSSSGAQANNQPPAARPRSAESRPNGRVSLLTTELSHTGPQPWGPSGARKQSEEMPQPSRFTLTTGDFPTLGSEKNPNLRPQQRDRSDHVDERNEERPPSHQYEDGYPQGSRYNDPEGPNGWGRGPFRGPPGTGMEGGYWRREPPPDGEEHWPPGGPYVGPPRFPNPEFIHQRFGPGPPGSYGQPGDGYGPPPFMRPMNPERPGFGPGMFPGPYDGYYGYPPGYNMDERMWGGPAGYGAFHPDFPRHPMGPRPRHIPNHAGFGKDGENFPGDFRGENPEFRRETGNKLPGNESKRSMHPRPHGQRDWGNEEPMDFSRPVFEKEQGTPPSKNHKVTFKAEPTVPDVAILKKPHPGKHDGESGDAPRNEVVIKAEAVAVSSEVTHTEKDGSSIVEKLEEKVVLDMTAGVLGKAPGTIVEDRQGSPRIVKSDVAKHSGDEQPGKDSIKSKPKSGAHPSTHESEKEWRPKLQASDLTPKLSRTEASSPSPSVQDSGDVESSSDVYDYEAQRAKMKEIAAQRARQLQKEEEERIKEQKAKAMAKLEELNRRSTVVSTDPLVETTEAAKEADHMQFGTFQSGENIQEVKPSGSTSSKPEHGRRGGKGSRSRKERSKGQGQFKKDVSIDENSSEQQHIPPSSVCPPQPADTVETPRSDVVEARPSKPEPVEIPKRDGRVRSPTTQEDVQTDERGSSRGNGGKRFSRKPKRVSSKSQDVRVSDKTHVAETMIWAPVRNAPEQQPPPQQNRPNSRNFHRQNSQDHRNKRSEFVESSGSQQLSEGSRPDGNRPEGNRSRGGRERQHQNQQQGQNEAPRMHDAPAPNHSSRKQHNNHQADSKHEDAPQAEAKHPPASRPHEKERHRDNGMVYQQKSGGRHVPDHPPAAVAALEGGGGGGGGGHQRPQSASSVGGTSGFPHKHFPSESHHHKPHYQPIPQQQQQQHHQQQQQSQPPQQQQQQQHAKGHYDSWSAKPEHGSNSNWGSSHGGGGGGGGGGRRGRFGGGRGMRSVVDMGNRVEKQRMVIDATGGALPNQVVG